MIDDGRCYAVVKLENHDVSQIVEVWDSMTDAFEAKRKYNEENDNPNLCYIVWPTFYGKPS